MQQWLLSETISQDDSFNWREETRRFKHWYQLVAAQCQSNHWLEYPQLDQWLAERVHLLLENNSNLLPDKIGLLGFQQIAPARELLFNSLQAVNISLLKLAPEPIKAEIYRLECPDNREEIKQAAIWAKQQWQADSAQRLGIVIPNLNQNRELTRIAFERLFCANEMLTSDDQIQRPFDISLGLSLSAYPLIDCALMLMKLTYDAILQDEIVPLLLSPYFVASAQQIQNCSLINQLRKSRQPEFTVHDLIFYSSQFDDADNSLKLTLQLIKEFDTSQKVAPSQWAIN